MNPIYKPKGAAAEYGDYALNIYTGCPHRCFYCYVPGVLHKDRQTFHTCVEPRKNIVSETARQIEREGITGKTIHLCFTCDPYPTGFDTAPTRQIIKLFKDSGNHVQILTKGDGSRDFDLLDANDWYGITLDGTEGRDTDNLITTYYNRAHPLLEAKKRGIRTWISFEPVVVAEDVLRQIGALAEYTDKMKIGKLNYHPSDINWADFGRRAEALCQSLGVDYYIKDSLRKEMEAADNG